MPRNIHARFGRSGRATLFFLSKPKRAVLLAWDAEPKSLGSVVAVL